MIENELDSQTPGGVYLCQVSETVSCGACCGLYNVADASRESLHAILRRRTERFASVSRTPEAIAEFEAEARASEPGPPPLSEFHHCRFVGHVGEGRSRVGCLLHPLAAGNGGVDFRGLSHYGGLACRSYFCPACLETPERIKRCLRVAADDWHLYGMVVTESRLLTRLVNAAESRAGRRLDPEDMRNRPELAEAFRAVLRLKRDWPFPTDPARRVHYFFKDGLYPRSPVDPVRFGLEPTPLTPVLRELVGDLDSADAFRRAEARVRSVVDRLADALGR